MTDMSTLEVVVDILHTDLAMDPERLKPDAELIDDLAFDSVAFAVGLVAIEERLGAVVSAESLSSCRTVGDVAKMIDEYRAAMGEAKAHG